MQGVADWTMYAVTETEVTACFHDVKKRYFPQWDRHDRWSAAIAGAQLCRGSTGYCDSKAKTIFLDAQVHDMPLPGLRALLVHEICHDVAAAGHNLTWAKRMERAAVRADAHGEPGVARVLRADIYSYCNLTMFRDVTGMDDFPHREC